ncbi:hypothetical protein ASF45_24820 [Pseudorhodoferax sp. Leaf265]|nr:hypothetical protein ASF45_24820 [Pseudorhodoferax sp. Leaf265]
MRLRAAAPHIIDTDTQDLPASADTWITCVQAMPHMDPSWPDKLFLTLTVEGDDYVVGDSAYLLQSFESVSVPPGSLFIVDPMTPHWLFHPDAVHGQGKPSRWIGLQWELKRTEAVAQCSAIIQRLKGRWRKSPDARYRSWAPSRS